jgi:hypothetical protein
MPPTAQSPNQTSHIKTKIVLKDGQPKKKKKQKNTQTAYETHVKRKKNENTKTPKQTKTMNKRKWKTTAMNRQQ